MNENDFVTATRRAASALAEARSNVEQRREKWTAEAPKIAKGLSLLLAKDGVITVEYRPAPRQLLIWFGAMYSYPESGLLEDGAVLAIAPDSLSGLLGVAHVGFQPFDLGQGIPTRSARIHTWIEPEEITSRILDLITKFLALALKQNPAKKPQVSQEPATEATEAKTIGFRRSAVDDA